MKKRYRLNKNGKILLITMIMVVVTVVSTMILIDRTEKIENGTMITQFDSQMDR